MGARVSPGFKRKVIEITGHLDISPDFLMACMAFRERGDVQPVRPERGRVGSRRPDPVHAFHGQGPGTSTDALAAMTAERQLDFVERYFEPYRGRIRVIEDIYMPILYPRAIGRPADFALFTRGTVAYRRNSGLDADRNGSVSKYEAASAVRAKYAKGLRPGFIG